PAKNAFKIKYICEDIPSFTVPAYAGQRYEDMVPDTLDIQERIGLAVNGLTGATDPEKDYMLYFTVQLLSTPPKMQDGDSDICQTKFMEALPLMRLASGSDLNNQYRQNDTRWHKLSRFISNESVTW